MRFVRTTVAALATAAALSSFASPAAAFTQRFDDLISHFVDCKILLLTDLQAHARECGGGKMPTTFESLSERSDGAPPVTAEVVPPKEDCEGYKCECNHEEGQEKRRSRRH